MTISFSKRSNKQHTLSCTRNDGSQTWMQVSDFFIVHDLTHYGVETILNYKNAFYGMLNNGINISDFEKPKQERTVVLSNEAIVTEHLVNLFAIEYNQGTLNDFNSMLADSIQKENTHYKSPQLSREQLNSIRSAIKNYMMQWYELPDGESLTLNFN
ncbi:MAG: hypothetical protein HYR66_01985 [Sphingobacteriales bacterium]|nr:hypothetical protein [Sphingobacteriales bacterium]MBI3717370.1 hypothetical protein [Sphingobacteriales bacterium]